MTHPNFVDSQLEDPERTLQSKIHFISNNLSFYKTKIKQINIKISADF